MQANPIMEFFDYEFNVEVDDDKVKEFQKYPDLIEKIHLWSEIRIRI